jgi:SapC
MQITPPFGYRDIVPLHRSNGVMLPAPGFLPEFIATTNAMPVSYAEFGVACRDFPIVFTSNDEGKTYAAVAVLGLEQNENLFVRGGAWETGTYLPAYVRRYPFCMARVTLNNSEQQNRLICIEKGFLADDGEKLFDAAGKAVEKWAPIERLLREYEADLDRTREMCAIVADYALLEPFTMQATPASGQPLNLAGMFRVREEKLEHLNAAQHKNLFKKGIVGRIYAHLLSLENFGRLLSRKARPQGVAAIPRGEV